jgi:GNAT superfamily N-acetyltransferase
MRVRPLTGDDVAAAQDLAMAAFTDLDERTHQSPMPVTPERVERGRARIAHLLATDAGGVFVAEDDGEIVGVALALRRDDVWGLSLLTVAPTRQSSGIGRQLLDEALAYGDGCRGWIILSSDDQRALRRYARAGFTLLPTVRAKGPVQSRPQPKGTVREGTLDDAPVCAIASRHVRRAAHTADLPNFLGAGATLLVCEDERGAGFAAARDGSPLLLAATHEDVATDLLRASLALAQDKAVVEVEAITHAQPWAVEVALDAGLALSISGAVFVKGDVGPMAPYLPSGAYL